MVSVFGSQGIMICIKFDNKFDWLGFTYDLVYSILVVVRGDMGQDKILKPMKNIDFVEYGF